MFFMKTIKLFVKKLNRLFNRLFIAYLKQFCSVKNNTIVFYSTPDYADNSRALSEYLEEYYSNKYDIYWCVSNPTHLRGLYPNAKVTFIKKLNIFGEKKFSTIFLIMRAKYVIATHGFYINKLEAKKEQKFIRLWHGCGYKDKSDIDIKSYRPFDLAFVSGPLFIKTKSKYWNVEEKYIAPLGYPRYDWLLKKSQDAINYYKHLCGDAEKLIMWMPTFRNASNKKISNFNGPAFFPLILDDKSWEELNYVCAKYKVKLLIKKHQFQLNYNISFERYSNIMEISDSDFEVEKLPMYKLLAVSDGLITDYSSVAFDYLLVNKPIAFALDDYENYMDKRGFVFDDPRQYMPGNHMYKIEDLFSFIIDVAEGKDRFKIDRQKVLDLAIYKSNNYCKEISEKILGK